MLEPKLKQRITNADDFLKAIEDGESLLFIERKQHGVLYYYQAEMNANVYNNMLVKVLTPKHIYHEDTELWTYGY